MIWSIVRMAFQMEKIVFGPICTPVWVLSLFLLWIPELNSFVHLSCLILASCSRINNFLVIWILPLTMEITIQSQAAWWTHYLGCIDVVRLWNHSETRRPCHILWGELMSSTILITLLLNVIINDKFIIDH